MVHYNTVNKRVIETNDDDDDDDDDDVAFRSTSKS